MDSDTACSILGYLEHQLKIDRGEIVLLAESSLYGNLLADGLECRTSEPVLLSIVGRGKFLPLVRPEGSKSSDQKVSSDGAFAKVVRFPAHIAQMRVESDRRRAELAEAGEGTGKGGGKSAVPRERNPGGSGLPPHAPLLTARTGEILLANELQELSEKRPKAIWITATDVRDKLFLAEQLRRHAPDSLVITQEKDLLLAHPDYRESTRGMLVASIVPDPEKDQNLFATDWAHGAYRALQELRTGTGRSRFLVARRARAKDVACIEAGGPQKETPGEEPKRARNQEPRAVHAGVFSMLHEALGSMFRREGRPLLSIAFLLGLSPLCWLLWPFVQTPEQFSCRSINARDGLFLLVLLPGLLLNLYGVIALHHSWGPMITVSVALLAVIYSVGAWCFVKRFVLEPATADCRDWWGKGRQTSGFALATDLSKSLKEPLVMSLLFLVPPASLYGYYRVHILDLQVDREYLAQRSFDLLSGVSPLVPLVILLAIPLAWALAYFQRWLDSVGDNAFSAKNWALLDSTFQIRVVLPTVLFFLVPFVYLFFYYEDAEWRAVRSLEGHEFDRYATALLALALALIYRSGSRVFRGWAALKDYTASLYRSRPGKEERKPWFDTYGNEVGMLLRNGEWRSFSDRRTRLEEAITEVEAFAEQDNRGLEVASILRGALADLDATPQWDEVQQLKRENRRPSQQQIHVLRRLFSDLHWKLMSCSTSGIGELLTSRREDGVRLEKLELFLATELGFYVRREERQIRSIMVFVTLALVALLATVSTYPFEPHGVLLLFTTALMVAGALFTGRIVWQMEKDLILSWLEGTTKNEGERHDRSFLGRVVFYEGLPLFSLITTQFPAARGFVAQWIEPLLKMLS